MKKPVIFTYKKDIIGFLIMTDENNNLSFLFTSNSNDNYYNQQPNPQGGYQQSQPGYDNNNQTNPYGDSGYQNYGNNINQNYGNNMMTRQQSSEAATGGWSMDLSKTTDQGQNNNMDMGYNNPRMDNQQQSQIL